MIPKSHEISAPDKVNIMNQLIQWDLLPLEWWNIIAVLERFLPSHPNTLKRPKWDEFLHQNQKIKRGGGASWFWIQIRAKTIGKWGLESNFLPLEGSSNTKLEFWDILADWCSFFVLVLLFTPYEWLGRRGLLAFVLCSHWHFQVKYLHV